MPSQSSSLVCADLNLFGGLGEVLSEMKSLRQPQALPRFSNSSSLVNDEFSVVLLELSSLAAAEMVLVAHWDDVFSSSRGRPRRDVAQSFEK